MTKSLFSSENVPHQLLKQRAYNYRWAETEPNIIPLTAADPDFAVAKEIRHAIADYALGGVFSYGPHQGLSEFKQALAESMANRRDYQLNANYILPIDSVASGMYSIIQAFINEGDEAIIFDPVDFLFEQSVLAAKGRAVRCPFDHKLGEFRLDMLEQLLTPRTKVIGVCNPHNPLGRLMTKTELALIAEFANKHDLWIMNDEIWSDIVFPEKRFTSFHHLPSELTQRVITCYGFSKAFGLAGLRVGAIICSTKASYESIVDASHVMTTAGGVATISQIAAITALKECWYWVDEFTTHLTQLRDYAVKRLNQMPGVTCHTPEATYLLFPNIELTGFSADEIVAHLLTHNVAVVPGNEKFFGPGASGHIRICFATSQEILTEGLDRMEQALNQLGSNKNDAM